MSQRNGRQALHYFAEGNTSQGSVHLLESSLQQLDRVFILKGGPGTGKSELIRAVGKALLDWGEDVWFLHCARDPDSFDGVISPSLRFGVVDGTPPHIVEPRLPGAVEEYVNLGEAWDAGNLRTRRAEMERLNDGIRQWHDKAYARFAEALRVHDEWEAVYIGNFDRAAADRLAERYRDILFGDAARDRASRIDRRFLGAATPRGAVDFVPNLTAGLAKRYFLKGRPGTGKSTFLKKLAQTAGERGFNTEIYHCGFDPNSVDMVIVRDLGFAVFDSTSPHEYFPERPGDEVIDMYELCTPGTDEAHAEALRDVSIRYKTAMKEATSHLAQARTLHEQLERIYASAVDFRKVDRMKAELIRIAESMR